MLLFFVKSIKFPDSSFMVENYVSFSSFQLDTNGSTGLPNCRCATDKAPPPLASLLISVSGIPFLHSTSPSLLQVYCGCNVNQHMLRHNEETGHKMVLSFASLSSWCYACDLCIHNKVGNTLHCPEIPVSSHRL